LRDERPIAPPQSRAVEIAGLTRAFEEMRETLAGRRHAERYIQALAHEVKAPLTAIRGAAELMEEDMPEDRRRRFLKNIRGESARIQRIVERLLELTSIEARRALNRIEPIETTGLVEEAAEAVRSAYAAAGVTLTVVDDVRVRFVGERFLLWQALVNLLQNALDFSPLGGEVTLHVVFARSRIDFVVEDRGSGVPDYALSQVFDRFYSLPRPRDERKSTGIGLALVREIARLHGGDATLENRSGGGVRAVLWVEVKSDA
jgi:two-component system sensor histidine kinase CreC